MASTSVTSNACVPVPASGDREVSAWVRTAQRWDSSTLASALASLMDKVPEARSAAQIAIAGVETRRKNREAANGSRPRARSSEPQVDFLNLLPRVVCTAVLRFLDMGSLARASRVSKRWLRRCSSPSVDDLWKDEFLRLHPDSTFLHNLRMWRNYNWRGLCQLQGKSRNGWVNKPVESRRFLGHRDRVRHVRLRRDMIVSSSWDRTLRAVNLSDDSEGELSKQVGSHSGSVYGVAFDGDIAVACSEDPVVKIWSVVKENCIAELVGHESAVYRVAMISSEILVSCSSDFVGVWHWPSSTLLHKLLGHTHDVHRIQVNDNMIVTGSYDCTVRVWGYPSCNTLWVSPACHKSGVSCLHFQNGILATGSAKGEVYVWDLETGARRHSFDPDHHNESTISCIMVSGKRVISTSYLSLRDNAGIICVWDAVEGQLLAKLVEPFHVNALKKDLGLLFCACSDGVLRVRQENRNDLLIRRELKHGDQALYDVDVQGSRAVTCGLDRAVVLWTALIDA